MILIKKIIYTTLLVILIASCTKKKENFVFILVDDLGWTDLGYSGSDFHESPNIDRLSEESIQFTNAYSSASVCSPSRAAIFTGKHPARVNITDWIPGDDPQDRPLLGPQDLYHLPQDEITLAEIMRANGYKTFFAGKWHLGSEGHYPENNGFQLNFGGHEKGQPPAGYYSPYNNPRLSDGPEGEYLTDRITDESIRFVEGAGDEPFFLFLSFYTVHTPIQASKRHLKMFEDKLQPEDSSDVSYKIDGIGRTVTEQRNPAYASMVYAMDENVGRLIESLKEQGLYENTTIIFTSDNGGLTTIEERFNSNSPTSVRPLRAGKGWLYEGGIRVPLLIKPANMSAKRVFDEPVVGHDLYPTLLARAGIDLEPDQIIDGIDLNPMLTGDASLNRQSIYWHYPHYHSSGWTPGAAIRQGDLKLIEIYETNTIELYNLKNDISETNNLAEQYPDIVKAMLVELHSLQESMNANEAAANNLTEDE